MFAIVLTEAVVKAAQGRGAHVVSAQAGAPQIIMKAGFGEAALANVYNGKAYLIFLCECRNVASRDDMFAIFLPKVAGKVAQGRGVQVASAQDGTPQIIMRTGFG